MLQGIAILLVFQLAGEAIARLLVLPVPGPVAGMVLLFGWLCLRGAVPEPLEAVTRGLLARLGLLYVPAGVGILRYLAELRSDGLPILGAILVSTVLALLATGRVTQWLLRGPAGPGEGR